MRQFGAGRPRGFVFPAGVAFWGVTAREQLREQVEGLSEEQARDVLGVLASRRLIALHQAAPVDDEAEDEPNELVEARGQARRD